LIECVSDARRSNGRAASDWVDEARVAAYITEIVDAARHGDPLPDPLPRGSDQPRVPAG
jgi:hypothetical protein